MKRSLCPFCRKRLEEGQRIHPECIDGFADARQAKAERKERKLTRQKLENFKTARDYIKDAQIAFNAYIRERDKDKPCICCGRTETSVNGLGSHGWDAGHYKSTGSASHLRFNEDNVHRQLVYCNRWGAGRAVDYRIGLIQRIGLERVEALEINNTPKKWSIEELKQIIKTYREKLKQLKENE